MAEEKQAPKKPVQPHQLKDKRKRVCGKWREPDYKASKEEEAEYKRKMDVRNKREAAAKKIAKGG